MKYYVEKWVWCDEEFVPEKTKRITMNEATNLFEEARLDKKNPRISVFTQSNKLVASKHLSDGCIEEVWAE